MTDEERAIWRAAYAAAFAGDFLETQLQVGYDAAERSTFAETPISIADMAVIRLREWRKTEEPDAGKVIPEDRYAAQEEPD